MSRLRLIELTSFVRSARGRLACAAVLGALTGSALTAPPKAACDCEEPAWELELVSSNEPLAEVWPEQAQLRAPHSYSHVEFRSKNHRAARVDLILGDAP